MKCRIQRIGEKASERQRENEQVNGETVSDTIVERKIDAA